MAAEDGLSRSSEERLEGLPAASKAKVGWRSLRGRKSVHVWMGRIATHVGPMRLHKGEFLAGASVEAPQQRSRGNV